MSAQHVGILKSGKTHKPYKIMWDPASKSVYVATFSTFLTSGGNVNIGKADSAGQAMRKAEAYLYDR